MLSTNEHRLIRLKSQLLLLKQEFEEAKHPRDQRGRFATGSGGAAASAPSKEVRADATTEKEGWSLTKKVLVSIGAVAGTLIAIEAAPLIYAAFPRPGEMRDLQKAVNVVSKALHFDRSHIEIRRGLGIAPVQGVGLMAANGQAELAKGKITIWASSLRDKPWSADSMTPHGIIAHEIMHVKFHNYALKQKGPSPFLAHPLDQQLDPKFRRMAADDGVTTYSRMYWDAHKAGTGVHSYIAYHETLAEMARVHYETGRIPGSPEWKSLYQDVNDWWLKHGSHG